MKAKDRKRKQKKPSSSEPKVEKDRTNTKTKKTRKRDRKETSHQPAIISNHLSHQTRSRSSRILVLYNTIDLIDILNTSASVAHGEETVGILAEPEDELVEFFAESAHGLDVHVGLGCEFGEGSCVN